MSGLPRLSDLIRGEHGALRQLAKMLRTGPGVVVWQLPRVFILSEMLSKHAQLEEELLLSRLPQDMQLLADEVRRQHASLDAFVAPLRTGDMSNLSEFLDLLDVHFDYEERELLPRIAPKTVAALQWARKREVKGLEAH